MNRDEVLAKVRKLLALSQSPNEHEAALAADRAQALLTKYKLEMTQVPTTDAEADVVEVEYDYPASKTGMATWAGWLLMTVSESCFCSCLLNPRRKQYSIIGKPLDVQVANELYHFLFEQIMRLKRAYEPAGYEAMLAGAETHAERTSVAVSVLQRARTSFALGCASRVIQRLKDLAAERQARPVERALMVVEQRAVSGFLKAKYPKLGSIRSRRRSFNQEAHGAGRRAGDGVQLTVTRRVGGPARRQLT